MTTGQTYERKTAVDRVLPIATLAFVLCLMVGFVAG